MSIVNKFEPGLIADGGTSPGDACDTHNQMLSRGNTLWGLSGPVRPAQFFTDGDSLSVQMSAFTGRSALWWAMALYNLDITFKRGLGEGTSVSGTSRSDGNEHFGMTSAERLENAGSAYEQSIRDGFAPIVIVSVQTNDSYPDDNGQSGLSTVGNVEKYFLRMRARGLTHMVINSGGPTTPTSAASLRTRGIVLAYRALAAKYRGQITFVDNSLLLADKGNVYQSLGGQAVYGATMYDDPPGPGLHPSSYGAYLMGKYTLGPALLRLVGQRSRLLGPQADKYDPVLNSRGALMGDQTRYGGSDVGVPENMLSGTQVMVQDDVSDPISAALGRPDIVARRFRFSGVPDRAGEFRVERGAQSNGFNPTITPYMPEANMYFNITNVKAPSFVWVGSGVGGPGNGDCDVLPKLEGLMCLYAGSPQLADVSYGVRTTSIAFSWIAGKEVAGDFILISASDYPVPPLPSASP